MGIHQVPYVLPYICRIIIQNLNTAQVRLLEEWMLMPVKCKLWFVRPFPTILFMKN